MVFLIISLAGCPVCFVGFRPPASMPSVRTADFPVGLIFPL